MWVSAIDGDRIGLSMTRSSGLRAASNVASVMFFVQLTFAESSLDRGLGKELPSHVQQVTRPQLKDTYRIRRLQPSQLLARQNSHLPFQELDPPGQMALAGKKCLLCIPSCSFCFG